MPEIVDAVSREFDILIKEGETTDFFKYISEKGYVVPESFEVFYRPYFVDEYRLSYIRHSIEILGRILEKVIQIYKNNPQNLQQFFQISADQQKILFLAPYSSNYIHFCRYDAFLGDDYFKYHRFNTDSPLESIYTDIHGEFIQSLPVYEKISQSYGISRDPILPHFLRTILVAYDDFGEIDDNPRIAITGNKDHICLASLKNVALYFESLGYEIIFCDYREWEYKEERLVASDGKPVSVIYRNGPISDWFSQMDALQPLLKAVENDHVCMVNPFAASLVSDKVFLALLQDPSVKKILDSEELKIISETIPWTRILQEGKTDNAQGEEVDLLEYVRENRENLVIKSCCSEEDDVAIGVDCDSQTWDDYIEKSTTSRYLVQSHIPIPEASFPIISDGNIEFVTKKVAVSFYSSGALYSGGIIKTANSHMFTQEAKPNSLFVVDQIQDDASTVRMVRDDF